MTETLHQHGVQTSGFQQGLSLGLFADVSEFLGQGEPSKVIDRNTVRAALGLDPISFRFPVDHSRSLAETADAFEFHPDSTGSMLERHFVKPSSNSCVVYDAKLVPIDFSSMKGSAAPEVLVEYGLDALRKSIRTDGFVLANIQHLLCFAPCFNRLKNVGPIVALGSPSKLDSGLVPSVARNGSPTRKVGPSIVLEDAKYVFLNHPIFRALVVKVYKG